MKSYLSLIPISARVRRRQNRLTILCIVTAVFLVTAIFSVADMMLRTQTGRAAGKSGSWHLEVTGITPEQATQLVGQPDVVRVGAGAVFNENGESAYRLNGKRVVLYGADADYVSLNRAAAFAGTYPQAENEVLLGKTAARVLHVGSGDTVTLTLPDGTEKPLTVTGVGGIDEDFYGEQYSIVDAYLPQEAFAALLTANGEALPQTHYELEYTSAARAAKALPKLRSRYGETAVQENLQVMGSAGQSSSTVFQTVYGMAAVLFVLVLLAGVLMISGSMNSNLAQRTQFFGMMRCIGMSKRQVIRFVRLEALNWCRTAVPIGLVLGTLASWTTVPRWYCTVPAVQKTVKRRYKRRRRCPYCGYDDQTARRAYIWLKAFPAGSSWWTPRTRRSLNRQFSFSAPTAAVSVPNSWWIRPSASPKIMPAVRGCPADAAAFRRGSGPPSALRPSV